MPVNPHIQLKNDEFTFELQGDWVQIPSEDPEQFKFESKSKNTSVVLSVMASLNIPQAKLVDTANKFAAIRQQAEKDARNGETVTFGDQWVELKPTKDVVDVAYAGYDQHGTIFRFYGFVTQRKVLSLWVTTTTKDNEFSKQVFDEIFKGLKFYVP